jgi:hypothetical protein
MGRLEWRQLPYECDISYGSADTAALTYENYYDVKQYNGKAMTGLIKTLLNWVGICLVKKPQRVTR